MDKDKLLQIKEEIEQAKTQVSQLKGRKEYLLQQLNDEWGCSTVKAARVKLDKMKKEIQDLDSKIEKGVQELEDTYDFD